MVTNRSFSTPILDLDFVNNLDIIVLDDDGFDHDTDTLTLRGTNPDGPGTSGKELFVANFSNAGLTDSPLVTVSDAQTALLLYSLRNFSGFDALNIQTLGGDDEIRVQDWTNSDSTNSVSLDLVNVSAGSGDDVLVLDNSEGLSEFASGLVFHGGDGQDGIRFLGPQSLDAATYWLGPLADQGQVVHTVGDTKQRVFFREVEPIADLTLAARLIVNATSAEIAIGYSAGPHSSSQVAPFNGARTGQMSVDTFEPIEFANKTNLELNALAGRDLTPSQPPLQTAQPLRPET